MKQRLFLVLWVLCALWWAPWATAAFYFRWNEGLLLQGLFCGVIASLPVLALILTQFIVLGHISPVRLFKTVERDGGAADIDGTS